MQIFRNARPEDSDRCFEIESNAYAGDEAATHAKILKRIRMYPEGFVVLETDGKIAGFINSGCAHVVDMADEAFKDLAGHEPDAQNVVILSVVVDPAFQGQGLSRVMMEDFIARMRGMGKATLHLMCKDIYVPLYEKFGYRYQKPSASDHGGAAWHEMSMTL